MGGSIRSSPRNSLLEKAASDHNGSEESVELLMMKSAKSANLDREWREHKPRMNSGLVKLAKQKTGKASKQSNLYNMKRGKIINAYFRDSESLSPKQFKFDRSNENKKTDIDHISALADQVEEVEINSSISKIGSGSNKKNVDGGDPQSVHQVPSFYQPNEPEAPIAASNLNQLIGQSIEEQLSDVDQARGSDAGQ